MNSPRDSSIANAAVGHSITLCTRPGADLEMLMERIRTAFAHIPELWSKGRAPELEFTELPSAGADLRISFWLDNTDPAVDEAAVRAEVVRAAVEALNGVQGEENK